MEKAVFIFGAGASVSAGLPVQADLLKTYFGNNSASSDSFRSILMPFFNDFFHIDVQKSDVLFPTFEEALGILDLALEKEETFSPNYSLPKIREIREALIYSMGIAIQRKKVPVTNTYYRFVQKLFHMGHYTKDEYAFINFNYDIFLDKALMDLKSHHILIDYNIHFANEADDGQGGNFQEWHPVTDTDKALQYLKPHGSLNWMYCPTCASMYILGSEKSEVFKTGYIHEKESCVKENMPLECVVEPPTFFKKYKNIYLQNIWNNMIQLLIKADVIIFIGYSLPESDIWTKYALKRAFFNRDKSLIVVNNGEREKEKYLRLLGKVEFLDITFDQFVTDWTRYHEIWK